MLKIKTNLLEINPGKPDKSKIRIAAQILKKGGIVAFPTETVYGLGADAFNVKAVKKIFKAKGRPNDNPLIIHIANKKDLHKLTKEVPLKAKKLISKFWPGPLTIVLKKSNSVPKEVTAGLNTVAVRMPKNNIALALIKKSGAPIAAPSANISGKPSPTSAKHVIQDLNGKVDAIINGGSTKYGLESTVIDLTAKIPVLLRPGGITLEQLQKTLKNVEIHPAVKEIKIKKNIAVQSPGMKYRHYAPNAKVIVVEGKSENVERKIYDLIRINKQMKQKVGIIKIDKKHKYNADIVIFAGKNYRIIAKNLFRWFRELDEKNIDLIIVEGVKNKGIGLAIMNRLKKAAFKIINA